MLLRVSKDGVMRDGFTICRKGLDVELSSASDNGVLYAAYDLLRRQQAGDLLSDGDVYKRQVLLGAVLVLCDTGVLWTGC